MPQPSPDARAVVTAVDRLMTQVKRVADAMTLPIDQYEAADMAAADDAPSTPATTCSARHQRPGGLLAECIRAAHHEPRLHTDSDGRNWSDAVAIYPTDDRPERSSFRIGVAPGTPPGVVVVAHGNPDMSPEAREAVDALVGVATRQMQQTPAAAGPTTPADDGDTACRIMETRSCPTSYAGPCGDRPCARFESDDPTPWTEQVPAADENQALRWSRRESLLVLLTRLQRGRALTEGEAATLRQHVETEMREADTARTEALRLTRTDRTLRGHLDQARADLDRAKEIERDRDRLAAERDRWQERAAEARHERDVAVEDLAIASRLRDEAQAAIERVRKALDDRPPILNAEGQGVSDYETGWRDHDHVVRAALDGTDQPTTEAT